MDAEVLLSLYLLHGSLQFITYIIRLTIKTLSDQTINEQRRSEGHLVINKDITR